MGNTELKRQRMENYFIDAVCELIREKGMTAATIRNVADKAGYNSATLYSYFKSFPHLLAYASFRFEKEMMIFVEKKITKMKESNLKQIWPEVYVAMADFLLDNPNIFECNFITIYDGLTREEVVSLRDENSEFAKFVVKNLNEIAMQNNLEMQEVNRISDYCLSLIIGSVLLSIKQRTANSKDFLLSELKMQIEFLIKSNLMKGGFNEER